MVRWKDLPPELPEEIRDLKRAIRRAIDSGGFANLDRLAKVTGIPVSTLSDAAGGRGDLPTKENLKKILAACARPPVGDSRYRHWDDLYEYAARAAKKRRESRRAPGEGQSEGKPANSGWPGPQQLPPSCPHLVGRDEEIGQLESFRRGRVATGHSPPVVISGPAGVGKTALAVTWLQQIRAEFPDGQLHVQFGPQRADAKPGTGSALSQVLRGLGVPAERIPIDVAEQAALYRSATAGRRLLVVLDNVVAADQVIPLLLESPGLVVVTSRHRLDGLIGYGDRSVRLSPLSRSASIELLETLLGVERVEPELAEAGKMVDLCDRLPLALRIAAAPIRSASGRTLARQVAKLRDEHRRIRTLSIDDSLSVVASMDLSYRELRSGARRLYCALGLHPGMAFSSELATAAVGRPAEEVERLLDSLVEANLLNESTEGRFEFADLIRLHARHRAMRNAKHPYGATERRIIEWYLHTTRAADRILAPYRISPGYEYRTEVMHHPQFADRQEALRWLDAERLNLIAVTRLAHDQGMAEVTWHLCDALWSLFLYRRHYPDRLEIDRLGVASAKAWGNPVAEADMLKRLGRLYGLTGDFEKAFDLLHEAIALNRRCGTTAGEADALADLGRVHLALGETGRAWELLTDSLRIHRERGDERSVALTLINCGLVDLEAGDRVTSIERFEQALEILERYRGSDPYNHARALIALGKALVRVRRHDESLGFLTRGLDIMSEYESEYRLAEISGLLGEIAEATGDRGGALRQYRKALQAYLGLGAHEAQEIEQRIAALNGGRPGEV